jgi:hypothetical protein
VSLTPFTSLASGACDAQSPAKQATFRAHRDRAAHVQEFVYDRARHVPKRAHNHDGKNSERIHVPHVANLILFGHPDDGWTLSGATETTQGLSFTAATQRANRILLDGNAARSKHAFGTGGCDLVLSFCIRPTGTFTGLSLKFGMVDGNTATIASGDGSSIDETHLPAAGSWKRVFVRIPGFSASGFSTDCRVGFATSVWSGGTKLEIDHVLLQPGTRLGHWKPGYGEVRHKHWDNTQDGDCPILDTALHFDNALERSV